MGTDDYAANALTSEPDAHDDAEDGEEKHLSPEEARKNLKINLLKMLGTM